MCFLVYPATCRHVPSLTLKMDIIFFSEMSVPIYYTERYSIPENLSFASHHLQHHKPRPLFCYITALAIAQTPKLQPRVDPTLHATRRRLH